MRKKNFFISICISLVFLFAIILVFTAQTRLNAASVTSSQEKIHKYEAIFKKTKLVDIDGKEFDLSKVQQKIVIINFWATWCHPCLEEFPALVELRSKFKEEEIVILAINSDEDDQLKNIKKTKEKLKLNFNIVADKAGKITDWFGVSAIPVSIIYSKGKVLEVSNGKKDFAAVEFEEKIRKIIKG